MPIEGICLRNPYSTEMLFENSAAGVIAWTDAIVRAAMDARARGLLPDAIWIANREQAEFLLHRYRRHKRIRAALVSAMNHFPLRNTR